MGEKAKGQMHSAADYSRLARPGGPPLHPEVDVARLTNDLQRSMRGEVRFDAGSRALYATDASNYRQVPLGVVIPESVDDINAAVRVCHAHRAPVTHRGGGTSLAGQTCNTAVIIDSSKYCTRLLRLDLKQRRAVVEPGLVLDDLRDAARRHGLTFGPDPSTHDHNTLGGMIGNNSAGVHSVMAGKTVENVESMDVLTYDGLQLTVGRTSEEDLARIIDEGGRRGEIYRGLRDLRDRYADEIRARYPDIPRRVSGYNLDQLLPEHGFHVARALVGSEGTCATVLRAELILVPWPARRVLLVVGFDDICHAADFIPELRAYSPIGIEAIDDRLVEDMHAKQLHEKDVPLLPKGGSWLLVEFGGADVNEAVRKARTLEDSLRGRPHVRQMRIYEHEAEQQRLWKVREAGLGATAWVPGEQRDSWPGWEDSAVAPERLGVYLRDLLALYKQYGYRAAVYGHFGDGLVHSRIDFGLHEQEAVDRFRRFLFDAAHLVVRYGGSLSGEHGDGQARAELQPIMFGERLIEAFREFRAIWDPDERMNPHKEKHSTRGRSRLLQEMLQGDPIKDGGRSEEVRDALDLCLSCKGCRRECPVEVDMATYKAEFLAHYFQGRLRPRAAYSMGLIHRWARLIAAVPWVLPWLVNFGTQTPGLGRIARVLAGISPQRPVPKFVSRTFRQTWRDSTNARTADKGGRADKPPVILWTDTFNNHFAPQALRAVAAVLQDAGYTVEIPGRNLCCGRPYYDYGMLDAAKRTLENVLGALYARLKEGAWMVGLEPSCLATFREELINFFPHDERAKLLKERSLLLSQFLTEVTDYQPPKIERRAIVRTHCYHKAIFEETAERELLQRTGIKFELLDDGCCGMAGSFGYEKHKGPISRTIAEHVLLPKVRTAGPHDLIVADGYSCREQIMQLTDRRAITLPEVIKAALDARQGAEISASGRTQEETR